MLPQLIREIRPLFMVLLIGGLLVGLLIATMGIVFVCLDAKGTTEFSFFGQTFKSTNVGIASIFIGGAVIVLLVRRVLKSVDHVVSTESALATPHVAPQQASLADLRDAWEGVNELYARALIGPDVTKAVSAMAFTAAVWNHNQMPKEIIYDTCFTVMVDLYETLASCDQIVPGFDRPGKEKRGKDFITPDIRRCYDEMRSYRKGQ